MQKTGNDKMKKTGNMTVSKYVLIGGASLLTFWTLWSSLPPWPAFPNILDTAYTYTKFTPVTVEVAALNCTEAGGGVNLHRHDPLNTTFYDDPNLSYSIGGNKPIDSWNEKRLEWLKHHPSFAAGAADRIFVLTGSQPWPCKSPIGDHFQLRLFKNKLDYSRFHGYGLFYNNALLHPKMPTFWAKIPMVRAAMVAHPEAEWIFWVDSDAVITDLDFKPPLERYKDHNLVVDGWPNLVYEKKSWIGVNAGVFLIRNCQWSMDFLEVWASMGPQSPDYEKWGKILTSTLSDMRFPISDDQSALVYLLLKEKDKWGQKIYIENKYTLSGFWGGLVESLEKIDGGFKTLEKGVRRHAEVVREHYAAMREAYQAEGEVVRRPFITHFMGCQPCSGEHPGYTEEACRNGIEKASKLRIRAESLPPLSCCCLIFSLLSGFFRMSVLQVVENLRSKVLKATTK